MQAQEKWKVLEALLKNMGSLQRHQYKFLGMNYSPDPDSGRIRFEYIFRNPQTVWVGFSYYPKTKTQPDHLKVMLVSPFRRDELHLDNWVRRYSSSYNISSFNQFTGDFNQQATALVALIDQIFGKSGMDAVLAGKTAVDIPSFSLNS